MTHISTGWDLSVSFIDDNGFINVGAVGGPDRRVLAAQSVTIHGKEKVKGVVSVLPPHVKSGDGVPKIEGNRYRHGLYKAGT